MSKYVTVVFDIAINMSWTYSNPSGIEAKVLDRVEALFRHRKLIGWVTECTDEIQIEADIVKPYIRIVDDEPLINKELFDLALWMSKMYFCSLGEALAIISPSAKREKAIIPDSELGLDDNISLKAVTPSEEQVSALKQILSTQYGRWYLYGPTGSGKTEVFLEAAEATIAEGRSVIYLVPEITLTKQVVDAVKIRFGSLCAVIHSGLTASQKLSEWRRIQRAEARIVVGARSAIFAPVQNLGLIVLDEEHEGSYKASSSPRYHARQVAIYRASSQNARLIMGSATPSAEVWQLMNSAGTQALPWIMRINLSKRLAGGDMPVIEIIDMRAEHGMFSKQLIENIRQVKKDGGQSILFLNRRGFSYFWSCKTCGEEMKCRNCSVGLTYHKEDNKLICHYCGYQASPPSTCPSCGSLDTAWAGFGTERIEEEAARLFPNMTVARLDSDVATKTNMVSKTIDSFRNKKIDILLGTQMIAKGLNFPGVKLVGIMLADTSLNLPDFRAAERTFSLITQVAGRAGRFIKGGKVVLQTYRPTSPIFMYAASSDIDGFYNYELAIRKELGFPPFARLLRIVIRSKNAESAMKTALELVSRLYDNKNAGNIDVLGPADCPIAKVAGNTRLHIVMRSHSALLLKECLTKTLSGWKYPSQVYLEIDPDPVSLL